MFRIHCIEGIAVDEKRAKENLDRSFGYATALIPYLGYKEVSLLVREALGKGMSLKGLIIQKGVMGKDDLEKVVSGASGPTEVDSGILKRVRAK